MKHIKNPLFLLLFSFSLFSCKTNVVENYTVKAEVNYIPYYLKVYEADSLFLTKNYQKSYEILDALFKKYTPIQMEGYYEYSNYLASSVMSGHLKGIKEKVIKGYVDFGSVGAFHPDAFKLEEDVIKAAGFKQREIDSLKKQYFKHINLDLRNEIVKMDEEDQSVRLNYNEEGMEIFQEKHRKQINEIIKKYGYPDTNVIGSDNFFDNTAHFSLFFLHQSDSIRAKYLPVLLDFVKKGTCLPEDYTTIYDRRLCDNAGGWSSCLQHYGSYVDDKGLPEPAVENPKKIDSIRKTIGLYRIGYGYWRNKIVTDSYNQKK